MPPTRIATATQGQIYPCRSTSERKTTTRAASVPVSRRGNPGLESLRSKKQKFSFLDVEDIPASSLPSIVIPRGGRKRDPSSCATSQAGGMASTSASVAGPTADASEQRPRKRQKRSSSTPAAPRTSQLSTQLQSRRRSRSRVGSPTADAEYAPPSRVSARLARKIHPFINSHSSDIYTHLADPDGAGNLLSEPPAGSVILSTTNEVVGPQSVKKPGGRRRKTVNLADENAKKDLMEEWARMRQSQGTLPLSGIDENACFSQMLLRDTLKGDGSVSSMQLEAITQRSSPDPDPAKNETTAIVNIPQSQETILDVSPRGSFSTRMDFENALPAGAETSGEKLDHKGSVLPSDGETEPIVPGADIEASSRSISDPHIDEASPSNELAGIPETANHLDLLQCPGSSPPILSASPSREDSVHVRHTKLTRLLVNEQAGATTLNNPLKDSHPVTFSQTSSLDSSNIHLDSDEEFYMLDIPEIFTLPWVPVASHLYVPPSLGKLISGMREQLMMEARARRRAEELYQAELIQRISAEKIIEDLRTELEERQKDLSRQATC